MLLYFLWLVRGKVEGSEVTNVHSAFGSIALVVLIHIMILFVITKPTEDIFGAQRRLINHL